MAAVASKLNLLRATAPLQRRSLASAAAAAIQYDDDWYDEDLTGVMRRRCDPTVDDEGSKMRRGVQWVVLGDAGGLRRVYAEKLSRVLDVPHISMAHLLLQELHPRSSIYSQIESAVSQGKLVPEDIIFGLLSKRLEEGYVRGETGFILDGIPRTIMQAGLFFLLHHGYTEVLDQIVDIDLALNFKCTDNAERRLVNGLNLHPPGGPMKSLSESAQKEKLRTFAEQSKLLEDFYGTQKKLLNFKVAEGPSKTWHDLMSVLQLQNVKSSFQ